MPMRRWTLLPLALLATASSWCHAERLAGNGLSLRAESSDLGSHWQTRGALGIESPGALATQVRYGGQGLKPLDSGMVGDYYFDRAARSGGFRATGGLLAGWRSLSQPGTNAPLSFSLQRRHLLLDLDAEPATAPYVGFGWSDTVFSGGLRLSADVGLMAASTGSAVKFGRVLNGQNFDDVLREMRLSPLLQVGVSYSF